MYRGPSAGVEEAPFDGAGEKRASCAAEAVAGKSGHGHVHDVGLGALIAYFLCLLASVSIRPGAIGAENIESDILIAFLAFMGAMSLTLLFLALAESYLLRHDDHRRLAFVSGVLMALGPVCCAVQGAMGALSSLLMPLAFSLSGCGYASCLLIWGRILSSKDEGRSSRQLLADTCAAVIVMVAASMLPEPASMAAIACLGAMAGAIGSRKSVSADTRRDREGQVVVSDTRNAIPRSSYFAGGMPWMIYGVFLALLGDVHVFGEYIDIVVMAMIAIAASAGIAIVRMHRKPAIDLSKLSWMSVPLLVTGLVIYVAGEQPLLRLAVVLIMFSMVISFLHLMAHFAALAHRPDLLSDQMFAWGWLAPSVGMFVGVFAGLVCRLVDDPSIKLLLSLMGGVLVVALIVSMRSVERIAIRRREEEIDMQTDSESAVDRETQMDEVFSDLGLSMREKEVASLLLQGRSQAVIAEQLFVAASTVNTHVKHIYQKASVRSKQEFIDVCQETLRALSGDARDGAS